MVTVLKSEVVQAREVLVGGWARPWERTGAIDVELLAQWAYGSQMVDRFERAGLHRIEAEAAGFEPHGLSADGCGQLMQIEHLGCRIDRGSPTISDAVHPAAYALASELRCFDGGQAVRYHALSGTRPTQWRPPEHRIRPAQWKHEGSEAVVDYQGPGGKGGYCRVIIAWDAQRETWGRAEYSKWWEALAELQWRLSMRSLGFMVTGPGAPAEPWSAVAGKSAESSPISLDESVEAAPPIAGPPSPPPRDGVRQRGG